MRFLSHLFDNNRAWAASRLSRDPEFFERQVDAQSPKYLWIGCADSRVPANEIVGLSPGEMFVHRNIANVAAADDLNLQSVLQYALEFLRVEHIIVCGHYGCGGVQAALGELLAPPLENWIGHIRRVRRTHEEELDGVSSADERWRRLCELNVAAQVESLCSSEIVRRAWDDDSLPAVHGWIYDLKDGKLRDLGVTVAGPDFKLRDGQQKKPDR